MKVSVSWSRELSLEISDTLISIMRQLFPQNIIEFYKTTDYKPDISWQEWVTNVREDIKKSDYNIICVTPENLDSGYLNFEAGAVLYKNPDQLSGTLLLADITADKIPFPMSYLGITSLRSDSIWSLIKILNLKSGNTIQNDQLESFFKLIWDDADRKFKETIAKYREINTQSEIQSQNLLDKIDEIFKLISNSSTVTDNLYWGKNNTQHRTDVFVIMPFDIPSIDRVYTKTVKKVCEALGLSCVRADEISAPSLIMNDIFSLISNSKVIVCDCTNKNANVFYELGLAHALNKQTICMVQNKSDIPFDINPYRYIEYDNSQTGIKKLEGRLLSFLKGIMKEDA